MAKGIGRIVQFGIAKETTRGTSPASATFWIPFSDAQFDDKYDNAIDDQAVGIVEDSKGQTRIRNWSEGKLTAPIEDKTFPLILFGVFGAVSSATNADASGTVRDHTITVGQSAQHQALSFYKDDPNVQDYSFANGMIDSLQIKYELKNFLQFNISVMAKKGVTNSNTPAISTQNRFLPQHLTFKTAALYSQLSTGTVVSLKSLTLDIKQNVESDEVLGSTDPADFLNKQFSIEGTLEALFQNEADFKTAALAGTVKALRIDLKNTDVTIGTAANPEVRIDLAKVVFTEVGVPLKINDLVKQAVKFKAHYSTTDSLMVSILCTNLQGSY